MVKNISTLLSMLTFMCNIAASKSLTFPTPSLPFFQRKTLKTELLRLAQKSPPGSGTFTSDADTKRFESIFLSELPALNPTPNPARSSLFSGEWECVWTNESELNAAVRSGLPGGFARSRPWLRTYQVIDIPGQRLDNYIEFERGGLLSVGSSIAPDEEGDGSRFNFRFEEAAVTWGALRVPLPPVGKGWGDLLYLDGEMRLQRDVRGDLLLAVRVGK